MTQSKSTKRALFTSLLSMLVCAAMLLGTTFAWFTDSVTSTGNRITAGNLDVELEYTTDFQTWHTVGVDTELFDADALWEPGYADAVYLRVTNKGSLALDYQFAVDVLSETAARNVAGDTFLLSEYLRYGIVEGQDTAFADGAAAIAAVTDPAPLADYTSGETTLAAGADPVYLALVVYMPTTVGNEANYRGETAPAIQLGLSVTATQAAVETDGFGSSDYDAEATAAVDSPDGLVDAIRSAPDGGVVTLEDDVDLSGRTISVWDKNLMLDLGGNTLTVDRLDISNYASDEMQITIQNGVITGVGGSPDDALSQVVDIYGDPDASALQVNLHNLTVFADDAAENSIKFQSTNAESRLVMDQVNVTGPIDLTDGLHTEINSGTFTAREGDDYILYTNVGTEINGGTFTVTGEDQVIFSVSENYNYDFVINDGDFHYNSNSYAVRGNNDIGSGSGYIQINGGNFNGQAYEDSMFTQVVTQR